MKRLGVVKVRESNEREIAEFVECLTWKTVIRTWSWDGRSRLPDAGLGEDLLLPSHRRILEDMGRSLGLACEPHGRPLKKISAVMTNDASSRSS